MRLCKEDMDWKVEQDCSLDARAGGTIGMYDEARNLFDVGDSMSEIRHGVRDVLIVEALQCIRLGILQWRA